MQTSYQFIAFYRKRVGTLDQKINSTQQRQGNGSKRDRDTKESGIVEYRKTLHRFRQFLNDEERFFSQLLVRLHKQFELYEAEAALLALDLLAAEQDEAVGGPRGRAVLPEQHETDPPTPEQRDAKLATFGKILVYLGDIARYREHYNDSDGRPRAGTDEPMPRKVLRGKRIPKSAAPRARNYQRAQMAYEQARLLAPDDGNASHQLAILASYNKDNFATLYHYYRALCVRTPYDPASDNLNNVLRKAVEQYRTEDRAEKNEAARRSHTARVERFKNWVVVLHGLWFLDADECAFTHNHLLITYIVCLFAFAKECCKGLEICQ